MSCYVHLRGLPFEASKLEVAQWFASAPGNGGRINSCVHFIIGSVDFTYNAGQKNGKAAVRAPQL